MTAPVPERFVSLITAKVHGNDPDDCTTCRGDVAAFVAPVLADLRDQVQSLNNNGIGLWQYILPGPATTHIAYVHEGGEVYDPERGWEDEAGAREALLGATAEGRAWRMVSLDAVLALLDGDRRDIEPG